MPDLDRLAVLVVEANPGMRTQLRTMLEGVRITGVQFAASAGAAIRKLRDAHFDLILCEFDLGEGQDGQHLLEDLRNNAIIARDTLFIMITSERNYERVIGTAELSPDDYILKPLTAGTLQARLERALNKREIFLPLHRALDAGDNEAALTYCVENEQAQPRYRLDFMRQRAELHARMGQTAQAETIFREILEIKPIPWARLGLGRMLFKRKAYPEAEQIFAALVGENNYFVDAYDWLARTRKAMGDLEQARQVLINAVELSPHRLSRLRKYAETSAELGHHEVAEKVMSEVVRKGKYSDFRDPEDHVTLIRSQLAQDRLSEARKTLSDLEQTMPAHPSCASCGAFAKALVCEHSGDAAGAQAAIRQALAAGRDAELSTEFKHALIESCLEHRLDQEAGQLAASILRNADEQDVIEHTREMLQRHGRADITTAIEASIHEEVKAYVANGAALAQAGDYDGAVKEMMSAVRKLPGNHHVLFNAALALLRHIEHKGWNERFAGQARQLINRARRLSPTNPRLDALSALMQNLTRKYSAQITPPGSQDSNVVRNERLAWMR